MAEYIFDTSALVKRYHPEAGTDQVLALFHDPGNRIHVSRLSLLETQSAFAVKVRSGQIVESLASVLWTQLMADVASGVFEILPVVEGHYRLAEELVARYGFRTRLRTLDALQLAVAFECHEQLPIDGFVVADRVLAEVTLSEKLPVILVP